MTMRPAVRRKCIMYYTYKKVKQSRYSPGVVQRVPGS